MKKVYKFSFNNFKYIFSEIVYRKEKIIHEMGQTYLKHNKSNYLIFCEENRNLLFGYFEDYFYENLQMGDYYEGVKKKS